MVGLLCEYLKTIIIFFTYPEIYRSGLLILKKSKMRKEYAHM